MQFIQAADRVRYRSMSSDDLRSSFVVSGLFAPGESALFHTEVDRGIVGSVVPLDRPLGLPVHKEMAASYFAQRREVGIVNVGGAGTVRVNGQSYAMGDRDSLYIGCGNEDVAFSSDDPRTPAQFYLLSFPAHARYPVKLVRKAMARAMPCGDTEHANKRVIYRSICPDVVETCQLVMGFTELAPGSVWNTMPPHTHYRRSEIYAYFGLADHARVFHFMGEPNDVRALVLKNGEAAISPNWSIHAGAGTTNYFFVWGMGGENRQFEDIDGLSAGDLR